MRAFLGKRRSPNQTETPEGFLVAHNVPISRAGWYEYLGSELPASFGLDPDEMYKVFRPPSEVFDPKSMASYEGKPLTDGHPPGGGITPEDATQYVRGSVQNVRQGNDDNIDLLLADIICYDRLLMDDIKNGKREVSAGYDYDCMPNGDGTFTQRRIVGNHVAVVDKGRAGSRVRINDASPDDEAEKAAKKYGISVKKDGHRSPPEGYPKDREQYADPVNFKYPLDGEHKQDAIEYYNRPTERSKGDYTPEEWKVIGRRIVSALGDGYELRDGRINTPDERKGKVEDSMPKKVRLPLRKESMMTNFMAAMGLKHFAVDADPEDVMEAVDAMAEERMGSVEPDKEPDKKPDTSKDADPAEEQVPAWAKKMMADLEALKEARSKDAEPEDAVDAAIAELEANKEKKDPTNEEESVTLPAGDEIEGESPVTPPSDRPQNALKSVDSAYKLEALKAIKPVLAAIKDPVERRKASDAAAKSIMGIPSSNTYAQIQTATRKRAGDTKPNQQEDPGELGRRIAQAHNPHYKQAK